MNASERALEDEEARLAAASLATGDPTGWFDRLYAAGAAGRVPVPWSRREPHPLLTEWAQRHNLAGEGKRAIVPGCGSGADAEYLAGLGFATTAFDVSPTAIRLARQRHPGTSVEYVCALTCCTFPGHGCRRSTWWPRSSPCSRCPEPCGSSATTSVARLTAPGGTLLVIAAVHGDARRTAIRPALATHPCRSRILRADGLTPTAIETTTMPGESTERRWRAEFHRRP